MSEKPYRVLLLPLPPEEVFSSGFLRKQLSDYAAVLVLRPGIDPQSIVVVPVEETPADG